LIFIAPKKANLILSNLNHPLELLKDNVHFYPGYIFGIKQASISFQIKIGKFNFKLDKLLDLLKKITEIDVQHIKLETLEKNHKEIVEVLGYISSAIQIGEKIPTFSESHINLIRKDNNSFVYVLVTPSHQKNVSKYLIEWLISLINILIVDFNKQTFSINTHKEKFQSILSNIKKASIAGTNNIHFQRAAHNLNIPSRSITPNIWIYGHGANQKILDSSISEQTSFLGVLLSQNKIETANILNLHGIPNPDFRIVKNEDELAIAAKHIGYPLVIKPNNQDQGRGVYAGIKNEKNLIKAYKEAKKFSNLIMVQKNIYGNDYRLTVVNNKVVKVIHRQAGGIVGDGKSSIKKLVEKMQNSPDMKRNYKVKGKNLIELDDEAMDLLDEHGLNIKTILQKNEFFALRRKTNVSCGGTQSIVPISSVHPDNLSLAIKAAKVINLDIAGIDLIIKNIEESWKNDAGYIIEINAKPEISIIHTPTIYQEILLSLLPKNIKNFICLIIVDDKTDQLSIKKIKGYAKQFQCHAYVTKNIGFSNDIGEFQHSLSAFEASRSLLINPNLNSLLIVMQVSELFNFGLPTYQINKYIIEDKIEKKIQKSIINIINSFAKPRNI
jgi:cyanophycin synthetase